MKVEKYLVLGGSGFIGSNIVKELQRRGQNVTSVSLHSVDQDCRISGVRYLEVDLTIESEVQVLYSEQFDYIINAMGYVDHSLYSKGGDNVVKAHLLSTLLQFQYIQLNVLKRYLYIGSADEYPHQNTVLSEVTREEPVSPYSFSKTTVVHFLQMLSRSEQIPTTVVRVFLTYGPGQNEQRFIPQIISAANANRTIETTIGEQKRDFCFIDDLVEGIVLALHNPSAIGEVINLASGKEVMIRDVVQKIVDRLGGSINFGARPYRPSEAMYQVADTRKAYSLIGWTPKVALDEGLKRTIEWYDNNDS
ncbi:NAD(P)-dependent oxidoreductase [Marinomonas piezotolerans]|uniref:NAD(P)-dependent oxidoreductase n=1 Tax=Marinomonas piezotolerans TaxID=2213058 RepID=A0A370U8H3_9GAMM|nr:NAD-dependent epimerase/dehydratase family protein [Marinomonas piezotolerans]RDL44043.1 NAD(P)-dependent oxidoreductase [Marinomonas piezotolerans]